MINTTQCTNCSSIFMISDEQYKASNGIVRCGTCRKKFEVKFLTDHEVNLLNTSNSNHDIIISDHAEPKHKSELLRILSEHAEREEAQWEVESKKNQPTEILDAAERVSNSKNKSLPTNSNKTAPSWETKTDVLTASKEKTLNEPVLPFVANNEIKPTVSLNNSEEEKNHDEDDGLKIDKTSAPEPSFIEELIKHEQESSQNNNDQSKNSLPIQQELDHIDSDQEPLEENSITLTLNDDEPVDEPISDHLIDEVDILINEKVIPSDSLSNLSFELTPRNNKNVFKSLSLAIPALGVLLLLGSLFIYQLWLKQLLPDHYNKHILTAQNYLAPATKKVSEIFGYTLPIRQDLNNLFLLSAVTEAHPTRASTTLLRVNFINRAKIEQALPWLELSLTNEDGRLVSRRTFSPDDYIFNNAIKNSIQPDELKKVTVELLAFPEEAHGYELRLVSKQ